MSKNYEVTVNLKFPPAGWTTSVETVEAKTAREAEKKVREQLRRDFIFDRHDGPVIVKARAA
jgi:hypothetical protein